MRLAAFKPVPGRSRLLNSILVAVALIVMAFAVKPAEAITRDQVADALRSTVQVIVPDNEFENFSGGSGTVMSPNGLILTNYHVVEGEADNGLKNDDALALIAVTPQDLRGEAVLKYFGAIVKGDPDLDLALVQIIGMVDDPDAPLPENLGLPEIAQGDSDSLMISDEINMFGFPGLGGNSATYTRGTVSGFLDDNRDGIYEWIKTDAELNHGNSGGLATDAEGRFVGVPTGGNVEEEGGGKIGLVRTGNLALDFVNGYFPAAQGDGPQVTQVEFAEAVNRRGNPINPAIRFDSGITDLYAVFDYSGFEDGKNLTYVWYIDGMESLRDGFPWDGGASGSNWVSVYNEEGLPDGFIELELLFDDQPVYRGGVVIGEGDDPGPDPVATGAFGPITFAEDISASDQPVNEGATFSDVDIVYAFFSYSGMVNGAEWMTRWYLDGENVLESPAIWDAGESGEFYITLSHPDGLPAGEYTLELYIADVLAQSGSFNVQGTPPAPNEVSVIGVVSDQANSRQRISGALVVFLQPGILVQDWIDADSPDDQVLGTGTSNARGNFQLSATVTPGEAYGVVVNHENYIQIAVDGFEIPEDASDPYELDVKMEHN
jgi:hypothetical protein